MFRRLFPAGHETIGITQTPHVRGGAGHEPRPRASPGDLGTRLETTLGALPLVCVIAWRSRWQISKEADADARQEI